MLFEGWWFFDKSLIKVIYAILDSHWLNNRLHVEYITNHITVCLGVFYSSNWILMAINTALPYSAHCMHQYSFCLQSHRHLPSNICSVAFPDKILTTHSSYLPQSKENSQKLPGIKLSALPWAIIIAIMTVIFTFWKDNKKIKIHVLTSNWHPHIIHPWLLTINLHKMLLRLLNLFVLLGHYSC